MSGDLRSSLLQAATSTFEELGFLFADGEPSESQAAAAVEGVARVAFTGPREGVLEVRVAGEVLRSLAVNMLGTDDLTDDELALDALGEVANVICGNVLPEIAGSAAIFDLRAPLVTAGNGDTLSPVPEPATRLSVGIDEGRADLALCVRDVARDAREPT